MSIQVNEFRHIPGKNDAEYIKLLKEHLEAQKQLTFKAIAKIKELSKLVKSNSSESPNGWIPCSERLPEKEGRYLVWAVVSFTPGHVDEPCEYQQTTIASYFYVRRSCWYGENVEKVIAWMPLPEPYKPEEESE